MLEKSGASSLPRICTPFLDERMHRLPSGPESSMARDPVAPRIFSFVERSNLEFVV